MCVLTLEDEFCIHIEVQTDLFGLLKLIYCLYTVDTVSLRYMKCDFP